MFAAESGMAGMPTELLNRSPPRPDYRLPYGPGPLQFGHLRLPVLPTGGRAPVVMFLHGGWWRSRYSLEYGGHLCAALKARGIATWSLEYRRVGDAGGGWPGTFQDVAAGYDFLAVLARTHPLDLERLVVAGHSAGGQLAFWLAGRHHIPESSVLARPETTLAMRAVVGLAGAVDLRLTLDLAGWFTFAHIKDEVLGFMGGTPAAVPERYLAGNPGDLLPLNVPQFLLQGTADDQIPAKLPLRWAERGQRLGDHVEVAILPHATHFDVVDPESNAWPRVLGVLERLLS